MAERDMGSWSLTQDSSFIRLLISLLGMILAVIALGGLRTYWLAAIISIVVGIAFLLESETLGSRLFGITSTPESSWSIGKGLWTGRFPGGIIGIFLGFLSLLGVIPRILLPVIAICFGAALILGSRWMVRDNDLFLERACQGSGGRDIARAGLRMTQAFEVFIGFASLVLGILPLALPEVTPVTLSLIAMLLVDFTCFLNGIFLSGSVLRTLHCERLPA